MPASDVVFATRTTTRLLDALTEPGNEPAWSHIDARYRPVIIALARRLGLAAADAEDVAQQSLAEFVRVYREGRYDRSRGRLSSWILGIAHHAMMRVLRDNKRAGRLAADFPFEPSDGEALRSIWADERDREILGRAVAMVRDETDFDDRTLLAFDLCAIRAVPAAEAASQCGMSVDQVYVARSRVTRRLREHVERLTAAFEEDA